MASATPGGHAQVQAGALADDNEANNYTPVAKRMPDYDVEYLSSQPRKKMRQNQQAPAMPIYRSPAAPLQVPVQHGISALSYQPSPTGRCRSMSGVGRNGHTPGLMLENQRASAPDFGSFTFSFPPAPARQPSFDDISPKQAPQPLPSPPKSGEITQHPDLPPVPATPSQDSPTVEQLSSFDFSGLPSDTTAFGASWAVDTGSGNPSGLGATNTEAAPMAVPPFNPFSNPVVNHNTLPVGMYSAGKIVPVPQARFKGQLGLCVPMRSPQYIGITPSGPKHEKPRYQVQGPQRMPEPPMFHGLQMSAISAQNNCQPTSGRSTIQYQQPSVRLVSTAPSTPSGQGRYAPHRLHTNLTMAASGPTDMARETARRLVEDIARTIQANFPCSDVAMRHGINPGEVAEMLGSLVVVPLLLQSKQPQPPWTG